MDTGDSCNSKVSVVTLPAAYVNDFQVSYTEKYAGIIGTLVNDWYFF